MDGDAADRAGAREYKRDRSPSSTRMGISARKNIADNKRTPQSPVYTPVTSTTLVTVVVDEIHNVVEDGSVLEPDDAAVKAEVAVSPKSDLTGPFPGQEEAGKVVYGWRAVQDGAAKAEVGIFFPSKRAAREGEFSTLATASSS